MVALNKRQLHFWRSCLKFLAKFTNVLAPELFRSNPHIFEIIKSLLWKNLLKRQKTKQRGAELNHGTKNLSSGTRNLFLFVFYRKSTTNLITTLATVSKRIINDLAPLKNSPPVLGVVRYAVSLTFFSPRVPLAHVGTHRNQFSAPRQCCYSC